MEDAAEADLEVGRQDATSVELRQVYGVLAAGLQSLWTQSAMAPKQKPLTAVIPA